MIGLCATRMLYSRKDTRDSLRRNFDIRYVAAVVAAVIRFVGFILFVSDAFDEVKETIVPYSHYATLQ